MLLTYVTWTHQNYKERVIIDGIPDIDNEELLAEIQCRTSVVINLKILDNDLINARSSIGYDPLTGNDIQDVVH